MKKGNIISNSFETLSVLWVLAVLIFPVINCKGQAAQTAPPPKVTVIQPLVREIIEWDEYTGRLQAVDFVEVRAQVSGYLQSINFKEGTVVKKGELLFVIDPRPFE